MDSVWVESVSLPHFEKLEGDAVTDVLIIGGGITGILIKKRFCGGGSEIE